MVSTSNTAESRRGKKRAGGESKWKRNVLKKRRNEGMSYVYLVKVER